MRALGTALGHRRNRDVPSARDMPPYQRAKQTTQGPRGVIIATFPNGKISRRRHLSALLRRTVCAAGLPPTPLPPYCLRRGMITAMAVAGVAQWLRMEMCGHRDKASVSHSRYVDPDAGRMRDVNNLVARTIIMSTGRR